MSDLLHVTTIVIGIATIWFGFREREPSPFVNGVKSIAELALLVYSIAALGWPQGLFLVVSANVLAFLVVSIRLAIRVDDILTYAATQSSSSKDDLRAVAKRLDRQHKALRVLGPVRRVQLICYLSQRARTSSEIEVMALPIALLWVVHRPELEGFVGEFDRLLRLWNLPAADAMRVADALAASTKVSAGTFQEMLDGLAAVAESFDGRRRN